jgi:DNA-binding NarL/FixJ family response regulator
MLAAAPPTDPMLGGSRTPNPLQPRVILVDDDVDRRTRLGAVLDNAADVDLIGTASDAASTSALLLVLGPSGPDIALVALDPPSGKSAAVVARLRAQHAHLRVWTYGQPRGRAATAGADGVLAESTLLEDLRWALRS